MKEQDNNAPKIQSISLHPMFAALKGAKEMTDEEVAALSEKMKREQEAEREEERLLLKQKRYEYSGVPKKFFNHSIDTYHVRDSFQKDAKEAVSGYISAITAQVKLI